MKRVQPNLAARNKPSPRPKQDIPTEAARLKARLGAIRTKRDAAVSADDATKPAPTKA
jgi:hypothetical protein